MSMITIKTSRPSGVTIVPNWFLDTHMPQANGEFVKIYLFLLRAAAQPVDFSLSSIADSMCCTEKDVVRALKYWAREGLLELTCGANKKPESITFLEPEQEPTPAAPVQKMQEAQAEPAAQIPQPKPVPVKKNTLTADKVKQLKENEDIAQLLFIAQQYLGKTLSPMETTRILYFYDGLGFTTDLIEYLIEYCVCKGHKSINYIEKVGMAWKEEGIATVSAAKKSSEGYHKDYYTILKALGIRNRNPIDAEIQIMQTWLDEYGFSLDIIVEACTRTILTTKQPSLQYTDGILQSWKKAGVKSLGDISPLDAAHEQTKSVKKPRNTVKTAATKFSNFEQRDYDFDSLESQLLNQ